MSKKFRYTEYKIPTVKNSPYSDFDFNEMKGKNQRLNGKTPVYLYTESPRQIAKKNGILIEKKEN